MFYFLFFVVSYLVFFFFSSRRRHTRYWRDWSSDVCSSDLDGRVLNVGYHQHRDGGVGLVQVPDHLRGSLVGEGYVHYGGVYAALGHPLASLDHRAALGHHLEVGLLVYHVGGGLAERAVILHKQDQCHLLLPPFSWLSPSPACMYLRDALRAPSEPCVLPNLRVAGAGQLRRIHLPRTRVDR